MKLRAKIVLILLFISVVPIFVVGYIGTVNARHVLEKQFGEDGVEFGNYVLESLHGYLNNVCKRIHNISHTVTMEDFSGPLCEEKIEGISRYLEDLDISYSYFIIRDASGKKVATKKSENVGQEFVGKRGFEEALAGKGNIQPPCYDAFFGYKVMMVSFPIVDNTRKHDHGMDRVHIDEQLEKEEVRGVLMVALGWGQLQGVIRSTRDRIDQNERTNKVILLRNDGHVYFDNGRLISSPINLIEAGMESAKRACRKETGYLTEMNRHGEETFIAYTHFRSPNYKFTHDIDWSILIERDLKLVFASVTTMRKMLIYAVGGCFLVLVLASVVLGSRLSKPILALSKAVKDFGEGDLSTRVKINRKDEIGVLGGSFNLMAERIAEYNRSLIAEVDERKKTEAALRQSEEQYRGIVENMNTGFALHEMICDDEGNYLDYRYIAVNKAYTTLFGVADPTGMTNRQLYPNIEQHWMDVYAEIMRTGVAKSFELYHDAVSKWWHVFAFRVTKDRFACIFYDVTEAKLGREILRIEVSELEELVNQRTDELKKANAELLTRVEDLRRADEVLRQSEEIYRTVIENIDIGVSMIDVDHNVIFVNNAQCKIFGAKPEDFIGKQCYQVFGKSETICVDCPGVIAMKTGEMQMVETDSVRKNGEHIPVQIMASPLFDSDNNSRGYIELVEGISERKRIESELHEYQDKLRLLASKLSLSEEQERHRIAGGLHDSIIQPLVFIKMKLETLLNKPEEGDQLSASMKRIRDEIIGLISMTRGFTFDLSYPILYEFGLEAAMEEWLREEIEDKYGLETKFSDDKYEKPIDDDMRAFLFRAFRELLVNIIKHANAKKIYVAVSRKGDKMTVRVEDDGIGFNCSETRPVMTKDSGFGLFGIRDRLEYLGGNFKIESKVANGTVVTLCAPLWQDV